MLEAVINNYNAHSALILIWESDTYPQGSSARRHFMSVMFGSTCQQKKRFFEKGFLQNATRRRSGKDKKKVRWRLSSFARKCLSFCTLLSIVLDPPLLNQGLKYILISLWLWCNIVLKAKLSFCKPLDHLQQHLVNKNQYYSRLNNSKVSKSSHYSSVPSFVL